MNTEVVSTAADDSTLEFIKPSTVPAYLRDSEFGASLNYDDDEEFSVPMGVTKQSPEVKSLEDLAYLLNTARFWGLRKLPLTVLEFAFTNSREKVVSICKQYSKELIHLQTIVSAVRVPVRLQLIIAMRSGYLDLVKYLHGQGHQLRDDSVCVAIRNEHIKCVEYALQKGKGLLSGACTAAVAVSSAVCCQLLLKYYPDHRATPSPTTWPAMTTRCTLCDAAALIGDIEYLRTARMRGWQFGLYTASAAASNGQLACLQYLRECGCTFDHGGVIMAAATHQQFDCVLYVLENGFPFVDVEEVNAIVAAGQLCCLQHMQITADVRERTHTKSCLLAARHGHRDCLIFLHQNQFDWDETVTTEAANAGHYDCLWYAIQHGCPVGCQVPCSLAERGGAPLLMQLANLSQQSELGGVAAVAAAYGYMSCLTYAVEHGCERTSKACTSAAGTGQLACLQYLHTQGFPVDETVASQAAHSKHYHCVRYALQLGCAVDLRICECLAAGGETELLELALKQFSYDSTIRARTRTSSSQHSGMGRCGYNSIMAAAARRGQLPCLQYLIANYGFAFDESVTTAAVWMC